MQWVEIALTVPESDADEWTERLVEAGAEGVEERDQSTLEKPPEGKVTLVVWVAPEREEELVARLGVPVQIRARDDDEWRDAWKKHFSARHVGRFVIVPSWESYAPQKGELVLDLDPGRAFGTGGHASTRLCLQVLSDLSTGSSTQPPARVERFLDVGCGSGILSIACARAWPAARGVGVDVEPDAIEVSGENAARNQVADRIQFSTENPPDDEFDVVTANIQPDALIPMAPSLAGRLAVGGKLILSGILVEAAPPVEDAYRANGLRISRRVDDEGWRALVLTR